MKSSTKKEGDNIQDKYDNLYLSLKNRSDYRKVLVLIEGPDDLYIYGFLLDPNKVILDENCSVQSGCATVLNMLRAINNRPFVIKKKLVKHLAILDADFGRVLNNLDTDENLVYTDYHDNEMMALHSSHAIENVYYSFDVSDSDALTDADGLFDELALLTKFRWHNAESSLGANFKRLDLQHFTNEQLHNIADLVRTINSRSKDSHATAEGLTRFVSTHKIDKDNQYEVTNGHDYVSRLATLLKNKYRCQQSDKIVERHLQAQLTSNNFHTTPMCQRIHEWERSHDVKETIVL